MPGAAPAEVAEARYHAVMTLQAELSSDLWSARIGNTTEALLLGREPGRTTIWRARTPWQAPEVDGRIRVRGRGRGRGPGPRCASPAPGRTTSRGRSFDRVELLLSSRALPGSAALRVEPAALEKREHCPARRPLSDGDWPARLSSKEFRDDVMRNCRQPLTAALALFSLVAYIGIVLHRKIRRRLQRREQVREPAGDLLPRLAYSSSPAGAKTRDPAGRIPAVAFLAGLTALNLFGVLTFLGVLGDRRTVLPLAPLRHATTSGIRTSTHSASTRPRLFCCSPATARRREGGFSSAVFCRSPPCASCSPCPGPRGSVSP